jgi:nickel transport protein
MRKMIAWLLLLTALGYAHSVDYQVDSARAVVVTARFGDEDVASYSPYEVFRPQEKIAFQTGRTDQLGRVVFAPDKPGSWLVKVQAESTHGLHGISVPIEVGPEAVVVNYKRPLVATHTKLVVGVALLVGFFGFLSLFRKGQAVKP